MRIIYITTSLPNGSGEAFIIPEVKELISNGNEVIIVPMNPKGSVVHSSLNPFFSSTKVTKVITVGILLSSLVVFINNPKEVIRQLLQVFKSRNPKILLKNLMVFPKSLWLSQFAEKWGADHIHSHWSSTTSTLAMITGNVSDISWSFTAHRWDIVENNLFKQKSNSAKFVRFISKSGYKIAANYNIDSLAAKSKIIHMGIEIPQINNNTVSLTSLDDTEKGCDIKLICPANLIPVKGHEYLINAIKRLGDKGYKVKLLIAGEGYLKDSLKLLIKDLNILDSISFLGQLSHENLLNLYKNKQVDAMILPSVDLGNGVHEGIPVSLMEAMGYGVPVISTTTGGIPELIKNEAGILVPPENVQALSDAIERIIINNDLRRILSKNGFEVVSKDYNISVVAKELQSLFEMK